MYDCHASAIIKQSFDLLEKDYRHGENSFCFGITYRVALNCQH